MSHSFRFSVYSSIIGIFLNTTCNIKAIGVCVNPLYTEKNKRLWRGRRADNQSIHHTPTKMALVSLESPAGKGVYTARQMQLPMIVSRMKNSKGFHSMRAIQCFLQPWPHQHCFYQYSGCLLKSGRFKSL